jgi:hypothetical protein
VENNHKTHQILSPHIGHRHEMREVDLTPPLFFQDGALSFAQLSFDLP